ncbi:MAG: hypothetical protein JW839_16355 [Candidatus Lokiarchaeota archaeon]|nr:hypothetical protein [Candidatus Lokiarchaeota archaeon]
MQEPVSAKGMRQFRFAFYTSLVASFFLCLVWLTHEDYSVAYVLYWNKFLAGEMTFVYPIGFLVFFSWLFNVNYWLPKLVFLAFHVVTAYQIYRLLSKRGEFGKREILSCAYFLFNPFLCSVCVYTGLFDSVIGFLVLNFVLLLESKWGSALLRDLLALALIGLALSIKFLGAIIVIPYVISERKTMLRRLILVAGSVALVLGGLMVLHIPLADIIQPFLNHVQRPMYTVFDGFNRFFPPVENPPFVAAFVAFYSPIALVVTAIALVSSDIFFYIKKVSFRTRVLLNIVIFLTFFNVSNAQFILWYMPLFSLAYNGYMPSKKELFKKMLQQTGFMVALSFFNPFSQFLALYFVYDIYKNEKRASIATRPPASQGLEGDRSQVQRAVEPPTPAS